MPAVERRSNDSGLRAARLRLVRGGAGGRASDHCRFDAEQKRRPRLSWLSKLLNWVSELDAAALSGQSSSRSGSWADTCLPSVPVAETTSLGAARVALGKEKRRSSSGNCRGRSQGIKVSLGSRSS